MDRQLWNRIEKFEFDKPGEEYGFSTRLADENGWTQHFTQRVILEYKKFMFLAATGNKMVSPSEIVDIVWHQHLIFTGSYSHFCELLGKRIEHIPSTHNPAERETFEKAKAWTTEYYEKCFGEQPEDIWAYCDMLNDLPLEKAKVSAGVLVLMILGGFALLGAPLFFLLKPFFLETNNPGFLYGYVFFFVLIIMFLHQVVNYRSNRLLKHLMDYPAFQYFSALELGYMKYGNVNYMVHGVVNSLIKRGNLALKADKKIKLLSEDLNGTAAENTIINILKYEEKGALHYKELVLLATSRAAFVICKKSGDKIKKKVYETANYYTTQAIVNIVLLASLGIGIARLVLGVMRDKPVANLIIILVFAAIIAYQYKRRFSEYLFWHSLPKYYRNTHLEPNLASSPEWNYFLVGNAALMVGFSPLVSTVNTNSGSSSGACGSSCGGGGGGCGGGCGGCGG